MPRVNRSPNGSMITLHEFRMGDVEDPYLMAGAPIYEWQQTDKGQWIMEHARDTEFHCVPDMNTMGYRVVIRGSLSEPDEIIFRLKFQ